MSLTESIQVQYSKWVRCGVLWCVVISGVRCKRLIKYDKINGDIGVTLDLI